MTMYREGQVNRRELADEVEASKAGDGGRDPGTAETTTTGQRRLWQIRKRNNSNHSRRRQSFGICCVLRKKEGVVAETMETINKAYDEGWIDQD